MEITLFPYTTLFRSSLAENEDKEINFESLEDTLTDMAVYCAMFAAYLENKKMNESENANV